MPSEEPKMKRGHVGRLYWWIFASPNGGTTAIARFRRRGEHQKAVSYAATYKKCPHLRSGDEVILVDRAVYLVRDGRRPDAEPEPARYMDHGTSAPYWQFFGTDDDAFVDEIEVVARMLVAPWTVAERRADASPTHEAVMGALNKLDGTTASALGLMAGLTSDELDEIGGVDETD